MAFKVLEIVSAIFIIFSAIVFTLVSSHYVPNPPNNSHSIPAVIPENTAKCPRDTLKFGVCSSWLGLVSEVVGTKPDEQCCALLEGLADVEAALCLCTAIKANVLGIAKVEVPVALSMLVNGCGKKVPDGFAC